MNRSHTDTAALADMGKRMRMILNGADLIRPREEEERFAPETERCAIEMVADLIATSTATGTDDAGLKDRIAAALRDPSPENVLDACA